MNFLRYNLRILLFCLQHIARALVNPKGIIIYSYNPEGKMKAAFYLCPSLIRIRLNVFLWSRIINLTALTNLSLRYQAFSNKYISYIVILFNLQKSIQGQLLESPFLYVNNILVAIRDLDFYIYPFFVTSSIYAFIIFRF